MCTLSIITPQAGQLRVVMNRDELRTRPPGIAPEESVQGDRRALMPRDGLAGGTWIGVNDAGLIAAMLNFNPGRASPKRRPRSRGELTMVVLSGSTIADATEMIHSIDPTEFSPFRLVVIDATRILTMRSDGLSVSGDIDLLDGRPRFWTSSSLGDDVVAGYRARQFDAVMREVTPTSQDGFHAGVCAERPELGVMMDRPDARTVSTTWVDRTGRRAVMRYADYLSPGPACERVIDGDAPRREPVPRFA